MLRARRCAVAKSCRAVLLDGREGLGRAGEGERERDIYSDVDVAVPR